MAVNDSGLKLNPLLAEMTKKNDLNRQRKSIPVPIQWTSHEYNLVDKKPRMSIEEIEKEDVEVNYNDATGSFFNFFSNPFGCIISIRLTLLAWFNLR